MKTTVEGEDKITPVFYKRRRRYLQFRLLLTHSITSLEDEQRTNKIKLYVFSN